METINTQGAQRQDAEQINAAQNMLPKDMSKQLQDMMKEQNAIPTLRQFTAQGLASTEMIQLLLKGVNMVLDGGQLLQAAVQAGKADLVQFYIEKGARVDNPPSNVVSTIPGGKTDVYRQTPFIIQAACHGDFDTFQALLKNGAQLFDIGHICLSKKKKNSVESNVIGASAYYGNHKILKLCLQKMSRQYHSVAAKEKIDSQSSIKSTFSPEYVGYTPLMLAVAGIHANLECVKILLASQADFRTCDKQGNSILHIAALNSNNNILDYLTKNLRMDIFARNNQGETALFICQKAKNQKGVEILEKFQQFDQSRDKTEDLLKELEDQERKDELAKQKKKEKKHRSKIQKLAKEQGVSVEELTKKFEQDEAQRIEQEKQRQIEEAEAERREEEMIREQQKRRIQWEIERKQEQERQQAEERRQRIIEEKQKQAELQRQQEEKRAAIQAKRQAAREARRKEQQENQPDEAADEKKNKKYRDDKKEHLKQQEEENHDVEQNEDEEAQDEIKTDEPTEKKKAGIEGLVGEAAINAMGKRAKKRYLDQKKKEEEEAAALKERILQKKKELEQEQREAAKQKRIQEKEQAKLEKEQAKLKKEQEQEQKKQAAEEAKKQKAEAKKALKEAKKQKEDEKKESNAEPVVEKKYKVKQTPQQSAEQTTENTPAVNDQKPKEKVYKKKEKTEKQKKPVPEVVAEKTVVNAEEQKEEVKAPIVEEKPAPVKQALVSDNQGLESALQKQIQNLEALLRESQQKVTGLSQVNEQLINKCHNLEKENSDLKTQVDNLNSNQQSLEISGDIEDSKVLKSQVKTLQTQLLRQNNVNKNLSSQLLDTEKQMREERKKRTEFEANYEKVLNVTQRQKTQDDASAARESNDLVQVQNYLANIKMRMQQSLDDTQ